MKDQKEKKQCVVNVRLTQSEAEQLQNQANNELLTLSTYVRRNLFYSRPKAV